MIGIFPRSVSTVYASGQNVGTKTVLAAKTGVRPFVEFISFVKGTNTSVALAVGGNTLATYTADTAVPFVVVGDAGDAVEVVIAGAAADSEYTVTCGYIGDPATPHQRDVG